MYLNSFVSVVGQKKFLQVFLIYELEHDWGFFPLFPCWLILNFSLIL